MVTKSWLLMAICIFLTACFSELTTAQTRQELPTSIPNLSGYDNETRRLMELACSPERMSGPAAYGACLNQQIASVKGSAGIPNLSGNDNETRRLMELACSPERMSGPVAYGACLNRQIVTVQGSTGIPNLSGYDNETRRLMELACSPERMSGPVAYGTCLNRQIASLQRAVSVPNLTGYDTETPQTTARRGRYMEVRSDAHVSVAQADAASLGYSDKVRRRVRPNIVWSGETSGLESEISVRCSPSGTLLSASIARSSGNSSWDDAALRAVQRSDPMPLDIDGKTPASFKIVLRPAG